MTYRNGAIGQARFTQDGKGIVYAATWEDLPVQVYRTDLGTLQETPVSPPEVRLYALTGQDEALVGLVKKAGTDAPTLARMLSLGGTAPKEVLENVLAADQASDGTLAVVRGHPDGREQLESPPGKVLFQSTGSLSMPRFSPDGKVLAFVHVLDRAGTRTQLMTVELASGKTQQTAGDPRVAGFAWVGADLWYGADDSIWALGQGSTDRRARRRLLRVPGRVELLDVAQDGRILLRRYQYGLGVLVQREPRGPELLSQRGGSFFNGWAEDGTALFQESRLSDDRANGSYLSPAEGGSLVFLGNYMAGTPSPDGKWILATARGGSWHLVPVGTGAPREIPALGLESRVRLQWLGPGRILLSGKEPGKALRMYLQDLEKNTMTPITEEGVYQTVWMYAVSPDRSRALAWSKGRVNLVKLESQDGPQPVAGLGEGDHIGGWCQDSRNLFVIQGSQFPAEVFRLDPVSGKRTPFRRLDPKGFRGASISHLFFTPDGRNWGCTFDRNPSELFVVEGVPYGRFARTPN